VTARPSAHKPLTKSYAIDQITDIEQLRAVAHAMWDGLLATREQHQHISDHQVGRIFCGPCGAYIAGDSERGCDDYHRWQDAISAAIGAI
jgi:hypothetical protein